MTAQQIAIPLSKLKIDPANVRKPEELQPRFLASIAEKGVIVPLVVRQSGDEFLVTDGSKRMTALLMLSERGAISADIPVNAIVREDSDLEAADTSLTTTYIRQDMHPADEYEAFQKLIAGGMTKADIKKRYGLSAKEVDQVLALGALSPAVRQAWKDDKIREDVVKAFTLEPDHKRQEAILKKLGKWPNRWQVRREIVGDQSEHGKVLAFVTREAYEAAGGKIVKDLFAESHEAASHVSDPALLMRLMQEKVAAECKKLTDAGWSFAEFDDDNNRYTLDRLPEVKAADRGTAGCMLFLDHKGELKIEKGYVKDKAAVAASKASATKAEKKETKPSTALSNALKQRLKAQLLKATRQAIGEDTKAGGLSQALGKIVAAQITPDRANYMPHSVTEGLAAVREAITPAIMLAAVHKHFDAKDFFASAPKPVVVAALKEARFVDKFNPAKKSKAETWKFAAANVPATGWLPKDLRGGYYTGPTPAAAKKAAAKKKGR